MRAIRPGGALRARRGERRAVAQHRGGRHPVGRQRGGCAFTGDEFGNVWSATAATNPRRPAHALDGGAGDDTYRLDSASDVIVEAAGGGTDTAIVSFDFAMGGLTGVEVVRLAEGTAASKLTGGRQRSPDRQCQRQRHRWRGRRRHHGGRRGQRRFLVDNAADLVVESAGGGWIRSRPASASAFGVQPRSRC